MPTDEKHRKGLERAYVAAPVTRWMGSTVQVGDGSATVTLPLRPEFHHAGGAAHGSIYFRALDDAAFFAANSRVAKVLVLTSSFTIHFLRPVSTGAMRAEGRIVHQSRRVILAESVLYDDADREIARGTGSFMPSEIPLSGMPGYDEAADQG